jgi:3-carboxy-cis,cis-muconate cycloisomerase
VDRARLRAGLAATGGQLMAEALMLAVGERLGRDEAKRLVEAACRRAAAEGRPLAALVARDPVLGPLLPPAALARVMDPTGYLGCTEAMVTAVLGACAR